MSAAVRAGRHASLRIGGASGFWGDWGGATAQLLADQPLDFIVYDYLAEVTMSILARARRRDPMAGYAVDFVTDAVAPNLEAIARSGTRIISNAGGVNPRACADAIRKAVQAAGLSLKVAVVDGDDLFDQREALAGAGIRALGSGEGLPPADRILSINAYLGAFPIAKALDEGADVVVCGRVVDSAVTLGACIHGFRWRPGDLDLLACGTLAGHLLECGTQLTGGNHTDWNLIEGGFDRTGYPIIEIGRDGTMMCSKPRGTGGHISFGTVAEQMVYEIGNPAAYVVPDVTCDFTDVRIREVGPDHVQVTGARGHQPPAMLKVCMTFQDGFRGGTVLNFSGHAAGEKATIFAEATFSRSAEALAKAGLPPLMRTSAELFGDSAMFGADAGQAREVSLTLAACHESERGIALFLREISALSLTAPPGLSGFAGARARPSPLVRLLSFALPRSWVTPQVDGVPLAAPAPTPSDGGRPELTPASLPAGHVELQDAVKVPLRQLAYARSGDKGNDANIGVVARSAAYFPYLWAALTEDRVADLFARFGPTSVRRYALPGVNGLNFVLSGVLGGGGMASLRNDPLAKGYSQILLEADVPVPAHLARAASAGATR